MYSMDMHSALKVAVLLPCHNEGAVIQSVIADFKKVLPTAKIYVYDNNSTDNTEEEARRAGAVVRHEPRQGKGNVVRRMFADVDADVYVLADGDGTYTAGDAPKMIRMLVANKLDMVTGTRVTDIHAAYRHGHRFGNKLLTGFVRFLFRTGVTDMLSGYRIFSRRFVKSFPALSAGFEIETECTIHAMEMRLATGEQSTSYRARSHGTVSKLHTYRDGFRIMRTIVILLKEERPFQVLGGFAFFLFIVGIALGIPVVVEFLETGFVLRLPTAVLATGLILLSALSLSAGVVLDSIARMRRELRWLNFLSYAPVPDSD